MKYYHVFPFKAINKMIPTPDVHSIVRPSLPLNLWKKYAKIHWMMLVDKKKEEVFLSGPDIMELLRAVQKKGAAFRFKATGSSMRPCICNNDMITVSPLKGIPPFPGEVVAFRHPQTDRLILHRVVRKREHSFFIKGDNIQVIESLIPEENILGVVTKVERQGKAIFWPDRFHYRFLAKCYFKGYMTYINIRRGLKTILRFILTISRR
jgi:hypothetical protein